jgi:DNA-binding CsgD family transcriptional regulator
MEVARLDSMGYTQQEISEKLVVKISQRTVSNDLEWLNNEAVTALKEHRNQLVAEHRRLDPSRREFENRIRLDCMK